MMNFISNLVLNARRFLHIKDSEESKGIKDKDESISPASTSSNEQFSSSVVQIPTSGFQDVENIVNYFKEPEISEHLGISSNILFLKVKSSAHLNGLSSNELNELFYKCENSAVVILLATKEDEKFYIYWKSREIQHFLMFTDREKPTVMFYEFVASHLAESLQYRHLGVHSDASFSKESNFIDLHLLADHRGFNLLLTASEGGNYDVVKYLIDNGLHAEYKDTNAQTLALRNKHFDILLLFLQSNKTYPAQISLNDCSNAIKEFHQVGQDLRSAIISRNKSNIDNILDENPYLIHFYDYTNESIVAFALKNKRIEMYGHLVDRNLTLGSHENFKDFKRLLSSSELERVREIHYNDSEFLPGNHLHVLLSNSRLGQDKSNQVEKYKKIKEAYKLLNENSFLQIILMIVAATRRFSIIFDFGSDCVEYIDPTINGSVRGVFYTSGRIYIGAKNLFDPVKKFETLGSLAHELCHYVMNVVYNNCGSPYARSDNENRLVFDEISKRCKENYDKEDIIGQVYNAKNYSQTYIHAELIVRVPHIIAHYLNNQRKIEELREIFPFLFYFYEKTVMLDMKKALKKLEKKAQVEAGKDFKKRVKYLIKLIIIVAILAVMAVIGGIFITKSVMHKPHYNFTTMEPSEQMKVKTASVLYKNVPITFHYLFPDGSNVYSMLTSEHISQMLTGQTLNFNDPHMHYLDTQIKHKWSNLTKKLKEKILSSNFTFQDESVRFKMLHELNSGAMDLLTSQQIIELLDGKGLIVHKMIKNETEFHVEREFTDENIFEIYYDFMMIVNQGYEYATCVYKNKTQSSQTFEDFYWKFRSRKAINQISRITEIRQHFRFEICSKADFKIQDIQNDENVVDRLSSNKLYHYGMKEIVEEANRTKIFVLSAEAGMGKTVTFEQYAMRIKKLYPNKWVSYIDLKEFKHFYNNSEALGDPKILLQNIFNLSDVNEFERRIFVELYETGNVILMWNGFDEISPYYSDSILDVLNIIKRNTSNIQFLCTRPLYSEMIRLKLDTKAYTLIPLDDEKVEEFLTKIFKLRNVHENKINDFIKKVHNIANSTDSKEGFNTPLMLVMIAELISNDIKIYNSQNLYDIYQKFVANKIKLWHEQSEFAKNFTKESTYKNRKFDMMEIYQKYALLNEVNIKYGDAIYWIVRKLKIVNKKYPAELTSDEISRMGILYINGPKIFQFAHKTFSEYFVAQYFIDTIFLQLNMVSESEMELVMDIFYQTISIHNILQTMITKIIYSFLQTNESEDYYKRPILDVMKTKFRDVFFNTLMTKNLFFYEFLFKMFKHDNKYLKELLRVDERETFHTALYNYGINMDGYNFDIVSEIRELGKKYLAEDDYQKFISGKNQKGIILFSLYCFRKYSYINVYDNLYASEDKFLESLEEFNGFDSILKNLTRDESKELITSPTSPVYNELVEIYTKHSFWQRVENFLTKEELKAYLMDIVSQKTLHVDCLTKNKYLLQKINETLEKNEIYQLFSKKKIMQEDAAFDSTLNHIWQFFVNHTKIEHQKSILKEKSNKDYYMDYGTSLGLPLNMLQLKFLHNSLYDKYKFSHLHKIYQTYFNQSEIQELFSNSSDFLALFIIRRNTEDCTKFVKNLMEVYTENEYSLLDFLTRKVDNLGLDAIELLNEQTHNFRCLSAFDALKKSLVRKNEALN